MNIIIFPTCSCKKAKCRPEDGCFASWELVFFFEDLGCCYECRDPYRYTCDEWYELCTKGLCRRGVPSDKIVFSYADGRPLLTFRTEGDENHITVPADCVRYPLEDAIAEAHSRGYSFEYDDD